MFQLLRRVGLWIETLLFFVLSFRGSKADIKSAEETVELICGGKSLIRLGDGEFGILHNEDIHYQKYSVELKEAFEQIKSDYIAQGIACPYILSVPNVFMKCSGIQLMKKRVYVSSWSRARWDFIYTYPQEEIVYGDAFIFEKKNRDVYSRIWTGTAKHIVFVHNSVIHASNFSDTYHLEVSFVECPPRDAFESLDAIKENIRNVVKRNKWKMENVLILISAGPAAKVLVYDLCKEGYHCVDTGHCWDDPLEGI